VSNNDLQWLKDLSKWGIIFGVGLYLHHSLAYNRREDLNKEVCHGKLGSSIFAVSAMTRLIAEMSESTPSGMYY